MSSCSATAAKGGKGNVHFKSSRNRAPRQYSEGEEGEEGTFIFELRTIADAGLVGYPNAGKSTLLRQISAAHPKVAPYPFTTLHPMIGVVNFPDYRRATVADIPGLIEGAHQNLGLGHAFLRHITRCRLLLFVLDMAGSEGRNPIEDLQHLRREIDLYDPRLAQRPWRVVANKMDLPGAEENLAAFAPALPGSRSACRSRRKRREGIEELKRALDSWLHETSLEKGEAAISSYAKAMSRRSKTNTVRQAKSMTLTVHNFLAQTRRSPFFMSKLVVASYCTTFLKSEMLHIYRQVTGPARGADLCDDEEAAEHRALPV